MNFACCPPDGTEKGMRHDTVPGGACGGVCWNGNRPRTAMNSIAKQVVLTVFVSSAAWLALRAQDAGAAPMRERGPEILAETVEYRTVTRNDVPLPAATQNVMIYTVPARKRLIVKSYVLPTAMAETGGQWLSPLGLGLFVNEQTTIPITPHVAGDTQGLIRLEPGVEFGPGARVVVRFAETVKALSGSLFLNGTLEPL